MDMRTGEIKHLANEKIAYPERMTPLTPREHAEMSGQKQEDRPGLLALARWVASRRMRRLPHTVELQTAFLSGYKTCEELFKSSQKEAREL